MSEDPVEKIFRDTQPKPDSDRVTLRAAHNEYEPAQIAVRTDVQLKNVRVEITPLEHVDGGPIVLQDAGRHLESVLSAGRLWQHELVGPGY